MKTTRRMLSALRKPRFGWIEVTIAVGTVAAVITTLLTQRYLEFRGRLLTAACQNSLPEVRLAEEKVPHEGTVYRQPYDFSVDWFTYNVPIWERALAEFRGKPNVHYLEIGAYEGRSVVWMLENIATDQSARVTVVDVFDRPYKDKYFANLERTGAADKVTTIANFSQVALRSLPLDSFDIIYIDGSHAKEDVLEDAVLSWRLLKEGGILIFDDYRWAGCFVEGTCDAPTDFPKTAIDAFTQCFADHLEVMHNSYQVVLRKHRPARVDVIAVR